MPTGAGCPAGEGRSPVLTRLPRPGSVVVRSPEPPVVPDEPCVDVRPGAVAVVDGDRHRGTLRVRCAGERWTFSTTALAAAGRRVEAELRADRGRVVRFGDRSACQRVLPAPTVAAIERRLAVAADRHRATLLTWTDERPGGPDHRTYDVVFGGSTAVLG